MEHLSEEQIAQYAEALAQGNQKYLPKTLIEHVKECDHCADEVMSVYEIISQDRSSVSQPKEKRLSVRPVKWVSVAAGITLLVGLGGYLLFKTDKTNESVLIADKQELSSDSQPIAQIIEIDDAYKKNTLQMPSDQSEVSGNKNNGEVLLAQAFEPNNSLENLASRFEQEQMRSNDFKLKSEHHKIIPPKADIELSWQAPREDELIFTLLNNRDSVIVEKKAGKQGVKVSNVSQPGLYYWKLMNADFDLLYCGKIEIEKP